MRRVSKNVKRNVEARSYFLDKVTWLPGGCYIYSCRLADSKEIIYYSFIVSDINE